MKTSELLRDAKALISPDGAWTRGTLARKSNGDAAYFMHPDATAWCGYGAIRHCAERAGLGSNAVDDAVYFFRILDLVKFNDRSSHEEVLAAFSEAITNAEAAEALKSAQHEA